MPMIQERKILCTMVPKPVTTGAVQNMPVRPILWEPFITAVAYAVEEPSEIGEDNQSEDTLTGSSDQATEWEAQSTGDQNKE